MASVAGVACLPLGRASNGDVENNERLHPYERALPQGAVPSSPHDKASRRRQLAVSTGIVCVLSALLTLIALVATLYVKLREAKDVLNRLQVRAWSLAVSAGDTHACEGEQCTAPLFGFWLVW
jgi:hypothetical protein